MSSKEIIEMGFDKVVDNFAKSIMNLAKEHMDFDENKLKEIGLNTIRIGATLVGIKTCIDNIEE